MVPHFQRQPAFWPLQPEGERVGTFATLYEWAHAQALQDLGVGPRNRLVCCGVLDREAVDPYWQMRQMSDAALLACPGIGRQMLAQIRRFLPVPGDVDAR